MCVTGIMIVGTRSKNFFGFERSPRCRNVTLSIYSVFKGSLWDSHRESLSGNAIGLFESFFLWCLILGRTDKSRDWLHCVEVGVLPSGHQYGTLEYMSVNLAIKS